MDLMYSHNFKYHILKSPKYISLVLADTMGSLAQLKFPSLFCRVSLLEAIKANNSQFLMWLGYGEGIVSWFWQWEKKSNVYFSIPFFLTALPVCYGWSWGHYFVFMKNVNKSHRCRCWAKAKSYLLADFCYKKKNHYLSSYFVILLPEAKEHFQWIFQPNPYRVIDFSIEVYCFPQFSLKTFSYTSSVITKHRACSRSLSSLECGSWVVFPITIYYI